MSTKTPEQMAEEYANSTDSCDVDQEYAFAYKGFLAGYKAAKDEDKAKMQELKTNWKFCCEDKARLLNELAAAERAKDQLADADKVMNSSNNLNGWISVKDRLPRPGQEVLAFDNGIMRVQAISDHGTWHPYVNGAKCNPSHWMELPTPPKEEK